VPLILLGITNAVVGYKLKRTSFRRFVFRLVLWLGILAALVLVQPIYNFLFSNNLTQTEPLSLFDVILITGTIIVLFLANLANSRAAILEKQVRDLHQELSIRLSDKTDTRKTKK
jgi:hypothetical protein